MLVYLTIRRKYSSTEMPGAAREWNLVRASGVNTTWSLCCINRLSMCEMSTMSVSVEQSMNAHGTVGRDDVGVDVEADAEPVAVDDSPPPPAPVFALAAFTPPPLLELGGCDMATWGKAARLMYVGSRSGEDVQRMGDPDGTVSAGESELSRCRHLVFPLVLSTCALGRWVVLCLLCPMMSRSE